MDFGDKEREYWESCLPRWLVGLLLAPFADEVGAGLANLAWIVRCLALSLVVAALTPDMYLDEVASGAIVGGLAVFCFSVFMSRGE